MAVALWMHTVSWLQILLTGKSINFLRQVCQDRTPTQGRDLAMNMDMTRGESFNLCDHLWSGTFQVHLQVSDLFHEGGNLWA